MYIRDGGEMLLARRRVRVGTNGVLHCRNCGSSKLLVRGADHEYRKTLRLKCAECDERQTLMR